MSAKRLLGDRRAMGKPDPIWPRALVIAGSVGLLLLTESGLL